jgi:hypothetical protein
VARIAESRLQAQSPDSYQ